MEALNITLPTLARAFAVDSILAMSFALTTGTLLAAAGTGETIVDGCMDNRFPGDLGCTANDVRVSGVADVGTNTDGICIFGVG